MLSTVNCKVVTAIYCRILATVQCKLLSTAQYRMLSTIHGRMLAAVHCRMLSSTVYSDERNQPKKYNNFIPVISKSFTLKPVSRMGVVRNNSRKV
jgi:hypothetical protein